MKNSNNIKIYAILSNKLTESSPAKSITLKDKV